MTTRNSVLPQRSMLTLPGMVFCPWRASASVRGKDALRITLESLPAAAQSRKGTFTIWGAEVKPSGCLGTAAYAWAFGDRSAHATTSSGTHSYQAPGHLHLVPDGRRGRRPRLLYASSAAGETKGSRRQQGRTV